MNKRIGLFGGAFNPIHLGHTTLAQNVSKDFALDEFVFMPAKLPPHKTIKGATPRQRYEMAELTAALLGANFSVSDYEFKTEGISYSHRTVSYWREAYPDAALFFIAGSDIFATIETWQKWREIFCLSNFIVVRRDETPFEAMLNNVPIELHDKIIWRKEYGGDLYGKIILYEMNILAISSTHIRERTAENNCQEMLTENVHNYIQNNSLYNF